MVAGGGSGRNGVGVQGGNGNIGWCRLCRWCVRVGNQGGN